MRTLVLVPAIVFTAIVVLSFRLVLLALGSVLYIYLFPWIVADRRSHPRRNEILFVCAATGWLVIPWIAAVWLATRAIDAEQIGVDGELAWNAAET